MILNLIIGVLKCKSFNKLATGYKIKAVEESLISDLAHAVFATYLVRIVVRYDNDNNGCDQCLDVSRICTNYREQLLIQKWHLLSSEKM